jgi:hypothetical protein
LSAECSRFYDAFFALMEMYVKRRAVRSRWQRTVERQNRLAVRVARSAHPQDFSSLADLKL